MSGIARFCFLIYTFLFEKAIGLSKFCHVCVTTHTKKTKKLLFSIKNGTLGSFWMFLIIVFFYKKGAFWRKFIVQCGINHTLFVMILSFGASKKPVSMNGLKVFCCAGHVSGESISFLSSRTVDWGSAVLPVRPVDVLHHVAKHMNYFAE